MGRTQVAVGGNGAISLSFNDHLLKASTKSFDLIKLHISFVSSTSFSKPLSAK